MLLGDNFFEDSKKIRLRLAALEHNRLLILYGQFALAFEYSLLQIVIRFTIFIRIVQSDRAPSDHLFVLDKLLQLRFNFGVVESGVVWVAAKARPHFITFQRFKRKLS